MKKIGVYCLLVLGILLAGCQKPATSEISPIENENTHSHDDKQMTQEDQFYEDLWEILESGDDEKLKEIFGDEKPEKVITHETEIKEDLDGDGKMEEISCLYEETSKYARCTMTYGNSYYTEEMVKPNYEWGILEFSGKKYLLLYDEGDSSPITYFYTYEDGQINYQSEVECLVTQDLVKGEILEIEVESYSIAGAKIVLQYIAEGKGVICCLPQQEYQVINGELRLEQDQNIQETLNGATSFVAKANQTVMVTKLDESGTMAFVETQEGSGWCSLDTPEEIVR